MASTPRPVFFPNLSGVDPKVGDAIRVLWDAVHKLDSGVEAPPPPASGITQSYPQRTTASIPSTESAAPGGPYAPLPHNHSGVYEPVIASGTTDQYWRGDKSWQTLPTTSGAKRWRLRRGL